MAKAMLHSLDRDGAHRADLADDYQTLKALYENQKKGDIIENWVKEKQRTTYVYIEEGWRDCEFRYDWLNNQSPK